jgi:hypothetical protein
MLPKGIKAARWEKARREFFERTMWHIFLAQQCAHRLIESGILASKSDEAQLLMDVAIHDHSKFGEFEVEHYILWWHYLDDAERKSDTGFVAAAKENYERALRHHYHDNVHHPDHWTCDDDKSTIDRMSRVCTAEMVCDWAAVSLERGASLWRWADKMALSTESKFPFTVAQKARIMDYCRVLQPDVNKWPGDYPSHTFRCLPPISVVGKHNLSFEQVYLGLGIRAENATFIIAERDGGIEVVRDEDLVWSSESGPIPGAPNPEMLAIETRLTRLERALQSQHGPPDWMTTVEQYVSVIEKDQDYDRASRLRHASEMYLLDRKMNHIPPDPVREAAVAEMVDRMKAVMDGVD